MSDEMVRRVEMTDDDIAAVRHAEQMKAQSFFAQLAADIRKPSYGVMQRDFVESLLKRAQEANLYSPEAT